LSETKRVVGKLTQVTGREVKKMVLDIVADLVEETPVDLGWARANWIPGAGRSAPSAPTGSPDNVDSGAQQQGIAQVLGMAYDSDSYIVNNVPYIERLNEGSSSQAPAGYVDAAIIRNVNAANARSHE